MIEVLCTTVGYVSESTMMGGMIVAFCVGLWLG